MSTQKSLLALQDFLKANPNATPEEIQEFNKDHGLKLSFSGPSALLDKGESTKNRFTYDEDDLEDMGIK